MKLKTKRRSLLSELTAQAGVSITAVTRLLSGTENSTLSTLFALLTPLGITLSDAAQRAEDIYQYSVWVKSGSSKDYQAVDHGRLLSDLSHK